MDFTPPPRVFHHVESRGTRGRSWPYYVANGAIGGHERGLRASRSERAGDVHQLGPREPLGVAGHIRPPSPARTDFTGAPTGEAPGPSDANAAARATGFDPPRSCRSSVPCVWLVRSPKELPWHQTSAGDRDVRIVLFRKRMVLRRYSL